MYDITLLDVKISCSVIIGVVAAIGVLAPYWLGHASSASASAKYAFVNCGTAGVLLSGAVVHLLPDAIEVIGAYAATVVMGSATIFLITLGELATCILPTIDKTDPDELDPLATQCITKFRCRRSSEPLMWAHEKATQGSTNYDVLLGHAASHIADSSGLCLVCTPRDLRSKEPLRQSGWSVALPRDWDLLRKRAELQRESLVERLLPDTQNCVDHCKISPTYTGISAPPPSVLYHRLTDELDSSDTVFSEQTGTTDHKSSVSRRTVDTGSLTISNARSQQADTNTSSSLNALAELAAMNAASNALQGQGVPSAPSAVPVTPSISVTPSVSSRAIADPTATRGEQSTQRFFPVPSAHMRVGNNVGHRDTRSPKSDGHRLAAPSANSIALSPRKVTVVKAKSSQKAPLIDMRVSGYSHIPQFHPGDDFAAEIRSYCLFLALSFHSVMEGVGIGAATTPTVMGPIFAAVLAHKGLTGFALGTTLLRAAVAKRAYLIMVGIFALCTPVGVFIGMSMASKGSAASAVGIALASGTFLQVALLEVAAKAMGDPMHKLPKCVGMSLGFACMSALGLYT